MSFNISNLFNSHLWKIQFESKNNDSSQLFKSKHNTDYGYAIRMVETMESYMLWTTVNRLLPADI